MQAGAGRSHAPETGNGDDPGLSALLETGNSATDAGAIAYIRRREMTMPEPVPERQPYDIAHGQPGQLPLLDAQMCEAFCVKPHKAEIYCVWAYHGQARRWKLFDETFETMAAHPETALLAAEKFARGLPGCWHHVRIMRAIVE